ncbi:MAG: Trk system potassium transporter TrkA [Neomegalonema sp.]|nr:Trk system potassium transporter TrkA [Neomegalonema sp.]
MRIIVCGAGQVGYQISRQLASEGNEVVVIDVSPDLVRKISDTLDVRGIVGYASHPQVLEQANAQDADMLIAATYSDEVNMVACQVAHTVFKVPSKIARIRSQAYLMPQYTDMFMADHMPIDVTISPEMEVAKVMLRRLSAPTTFDSAFFMGGRLHALATRVVEECPIVNTPLKHIAELFSEIKVCAYVRGGRLHLARPDDQLFVGDEVYFVARQGDVDRALDHFNQKSEPVRRVVLVGAGNIGVHLAELLEAQGKRAKLIERNRARAENAAEVLERTIVIHGDGLDRTVLEEAGVGETEAIVTLTDDDKVNVLACSLGKQLGSKRGLALTNDPNLAPLADPLGIDAFVNPRSTTVSSILRHVRRGRIRELYALRDGEGELIEAKVLQTSQLHGKNLREIDMPPGALICAVLKGTEILLPHQDVRIEADDLVVIFSLKPAVPQVEALFRVSIDFF